jgi:hypothetical protein
MPAAQLTTLGLHKGIHRRKLYNVVPYNHISQVYEKKGCNCGIGLICKKTLKEIRILI